MKTFTAIVERDYDTKLYVGYVPGFPGAHSQGETLDELQENLHEVIEMLLEDENITFQTFKAILRGNSVEWTDETPELGDLPITVHITIVEENLSSDTRSR